MTVPLVGSKNSSTLEPFLSYAYISAQALAIFTRWTIGQCWLHEQSFYHQEQLRQQIQGRIRWK